MKPYFSDKTCTIYHGDSYELLPQIEADVLCTDPQYGIGFDVTRERRRAPIGLNFSSANRHLPRDPVWLPLQQQDTIKFDPSPFLGFKEIILWGAHNYAHLLPPSRGWLIWDKLRDKKPSNFGDAELAWTNKDMPLRIWRQLWRGMVREGEENLSRARKLHPCQKPASLMRWALQFTEGKIVLDPFMGSGTTLLAGKDLGRITIGIELEERYCEAAARRLEQEVLAYA
ncbi:MAG: site-specific DNA-methyltransferase [Patescibacteria group bacterium]|nr:site-specific DNA-methyltransferase [Patescibacteria group bacterium]